MLHPSRLLSGDNQSKAVYAHAAFSGTVEENSESPRCIAKNGEKCYSSQEWSRTVAVPAVGRPHKRAEAIRDWIISAKRPKIPEGIPKEASATAFFLTVPLALPQKCAEST